MMRLNPPTSTRAAPRPGKGRPTPKRKDAKPRICTRWCPPTASAKAAQGPHPREGRRAVRGNEERRHQQHAGRNGSPWRVYIRDYVDARFNIGEFFIPIALVIMIGSMVLSYVIRNAWASIIP